MTDPASAPAEDRCGVFVSPTGSDANPGTRRSPCRTLQKAIDVALTKGVHRVYAGEGLFGQEVALPSGVDLWGGRCCAGGSWVAGGLEHTTVVAPKPVGVPLRVIDGLMDATSMIFGVRIEVADASAPDGKSSIGVILSPAPRAHLRSCEIVTGDGADGEHGEDALSSSAADGTSGNNGTDACAAERPDRAAGDHRVRGRSLDPGWKRRRRWMERGRRRAGRYPLAGGESTEQGRSRTGRGRRHAVYVG